MMSNQTVRYHSNYYDEGSNYVGKLIRQVTKEKLKDDKK